MTETTTGPYREHLDRALVDRHLARVEEHWKSAQAALGDAGGDLDETAWTLRDAAVDVPTLLRLVRAMRPGYDLLGPARYLLDRVSAATSLGDLAAASANVAQRIADEIGDPMEGEPALGPELREQVARLAVLNAKLKAAVENLRAENERLCADNDRLRRRLPESQLSLTAALRCVEAAVSAGQEATITMPASGQVHIMLRRTSADAAVERQVETLRRAHRSNAAEIVELRDALDTAQRGQWLAEVDLAEARLEADLLRRQVADLQERMDAERAAGWSPKAYPSRPSTPEQQRSVELGECRVDWPALVQPCDPQVTSIGGLWLSCTADTASGSGAAPTIRAIRPGDTWSGLVADVVAHRCQLAGSDDGSVCCGGSDCAGKCGEAEANASAA